MKKKELYFPLEYYPIFIKPIRNKIGLINVLMESIKYMIINPTINDSKKHGKIILQIDKMSRLFFITDGKYFSINFPFTLINEKIWFRNLLEIDSEVISKLKTVINCNEFNSNCSLNFIEPIFALEEEYNENFWILLKELFMMEDGYIRYDYDNETYQKFKENGEEKKHPLNHYDVFYSSNTTFKIGLNKSITEDDFIDFLNINTNCKSIN